MGAGKGGPKEPRESDEDRFWRCVPRDRKVGSAGVPWVEPAFVRALEDTSGLATIFKAKDDVRAAAIGVREETMAMMGGGSKNDDPASVSGGSDSAAGDTGEEDDDFKLFIDESPFSAKKGKTGGPEKEDVDDSVAESQDANLEAVPEDDPLFPHNPLDIKVDGEITLREKIEPLNRFWRERASKRHEAAQNKLLELLPDLRKVSLPVELPDPSKTSDSPKASRAPDPLNSTRLRRRLNEAEPLYFYRSTAVDLNRAQAAAVRHLGQRIEGYWRRRHPVFLQSPPSGVLFGRMIELALECPRILLRKFDFNGLGLGYLDELPKDKSPYAALLFQILFSHLSQHIAARTKKYPYHREAYVLHQASIALAGRAGGLEGILSDVEMSTARRFFQKFRRGEIFSYDEKYAIRGFVEKVEGDKVSEMSEAELQRRLFTTFAPSLALFDKLGGDTKKAREFIDARLSLLLPTRRNVGKDDSLFSEGENPDQLPRLARVVQEDSITFDLIAFARATGLYDGDPGSEDNGYKDVFDALAHYRQLQFFIDFHLKPETPDKSRMSLSKLLILVKALFQRDGLKPTVSSFGCGGRLLERMLLGRGGIARIDAVDKYKGGEYEKVEEIGSKFKAVSIPVPSGDDGENSQAFRERVLGALPPADVVLAPDSLHETRNPRDYLIRLFTQKVREGGCLYVADPIHCRAVDEQTKDTVNIHDSTDFPASMLSLEDYLEILCYLSAIGAEVIAVNIVPGAYAGYGDGFARLSFVLGKLHEEDMPYKIPAKTKGAIKGEFLKEDKDIFEVFPLNLVPEDQRERVLEIIGPGFSRDPLNKIEFAEVRSFVIARFLKLGEPVTAEATGFRGRIQHTLFSPISTLIKSRPSFRGHAGVRQHLVENRYLPYPVEQLLEIAGEPNDELRTRNRTAGDVIALWQLLRDVCHTDITDELRKQRGWKYFL